MTGDKASQSEYIYLYQKLCCRIPNWRESAFTTILVAESMYANCEMNRNQHLLFEAILDHESDEHAATEEHRLIEVNGMYIA